MGILQYLAWKYTILPRMKEVKKLLPEAKVYPNGSRYVCNPPVMNTDIDFLVYTKELAFPRLLNAGYEKSDGDQYIRMATGGSYPVQEIRSCWRKGVVNLVLTDDWEFAQKHRVATHLVKRFNIRDKSCRVGVYEALRGNWNSLSWNTYPWMLPPELKSILDKMDGPYGETVIAAYRAKHGIDDE